MFAFGIRVDLQTQLQKMQNLKIIARESSDKVDSAMSLAEIGLKLGAAYIMKGSVERVLDLGDADRTEYWFKRHKALAPEFVREDEPAIDGDNVRAAVDLALVLIRNGEQERANLILDRCVIQLLRFQGASVDT